MTRPAAWGCGVALIVLAGIATAEEARIEDAPSDEVVVVPESSAEEPAPKDTPLAEKRADPERGIVLTISGGISLGSYEAGLNWALLRLIKASQRKENSPGAFSGSMDLVSMTGASAGNINAFLSAVEWFGAAPDEQPVAERNLFWEAWIPVGLDQLFPGDKSCDEYKGALGGAGLDCDKESATYRPDDGVFSRHAFTRIIDALKRRMQGEFPDSERSFPLGVTVSKVKPEKVNGDSLDSLEVKTQRFAVLLEAKVVRQRLVFAQPKATNAALVGNQLFLPSQDGVVSPDDVIKLIQASSAFPLAFGPVELEYCLPEQWDGDCRQTQTEPFFDGGLFDNLPMGLALETLAQSQPAPGADHTLIYLDPERRRNLSIQVPPSPGQSPADAGHGIDYLLGLVGRFISVARTYELQTSIRFGRDIRARPEATSRYLPIFGGYLGAFAGFLARPFREFDFHAGVYDALYHVAALECEKTTPVVNAVAIDPTHPMTRSARAQCLIEKVQLYLGLLNIKPESATAFVVKSTLPFELRDLLEAEWPAFERAQQEALLAFAEPFAPDPGTASVPPQSPTALLRKLHDAMIDVRTAHLKKGKEPGFLSVLDTIGDLGETAPFIDEDACGRILFSNREALLGSVARQIARRLVDIEEADDGRGASALGSTSNGVGGYVAGGAQFITEAYFNGLEYDNRVRWSPSTVPAGANAVAKTWDALVPYYLTADMVSGGLELGYLPTLHLWGSGAGLTLPLAPLSWNRQDDTLGGRVGLGYAWSGRFGILSRFELGPYTRWHYNAINRGWLGLELALQVLYNRVRLSANVDAWAPFGGDEADAAGRTWTIRAGVGDLNGVLYWIGRAML